MENQFEIKDGVLIHCTVNQPDVIIPDGVNEIGYHAYREGDSIYGQDKIVSVTIPEGVTKIGDSAFRNCKNLEKVTILGPAEIGRDAFCGCKKLTDVFLADGVRSIGYHCFAFCEKLSYLYLPESVVRIETVIAEREINNGSALFDVRLHIHWIKNENSKQSLEKVLKMISQEVTTWTYNDDDNEIEVLLAHKQRKATKYKIYKPSEFPHQFFADLKTDAERWGDLDQIVIQPYSLYQKLHSYSDDYKDAAEAYGEDCSDWYSTERSTSGQRLIYEVG